MKYKRFEDLPVWQIAGRMAAKMFRWSSHTLFRGKGDLANQLQRATLSISNNIAEGFERGTTKELIHFLYIARGSAGEVRSMLCVMNQMPEFQNLKSEISDFKEMGESISRQLAAWTKSLQNSDITGQRHLTENSKARYDDRKRREAFEDQQAAWRKEFNETLKEKARSRSS